jgi:hypothetical protein
MAIVNTGNWLQAAVSTGATGLRTATAILRRQGYQVTTSSMGNQVTNLGVLKMTMINVGKGNQEDTFEVTHILRCHIPELRENL